MRYYPVNLDLHNRTCLVVGGGRVGTRKVRTLLQCGAVVTVVTSACTETLQSLAENGAIRLQCRFYEPADLDHVFLVFAATADSALNQRIAADAHRMNVLCNIADAPVDSDFVVPATFTRGDLTIAISTAGKSPALARRIRLVLEEQWGEEYAVLLDIMGHVRRLLLQDDHDPDAHKAVFNRLLDADLPEMLKCGDLAAVETLLAEVLNGRCRLEDIMERELMAAAAAKTATERTG